MKRSLDMFMHRRESSVSSVSCEELSTGDLSTSSRGSKVRLVANIAILAVSSPEIKALDLKRTESFVYRSCNMLPSPNNSSDASLQNLSVTSVYGDFDQNGDFEETDFPDSGDFASSEGMEDPGDQLAALTLDNLSIEPPPSPIRKVSDIASILDGDLSDLDDKPPPSPIPVKASAVDGRHHERNGIYVEITGSREEGKENAAPRVASAKNQGFEAKKRGPTSTKPKSRFLTFGSRSSSIRNVTKGVDLVNTEGSTEDKKPKLRRPSMHRRASFDSLPSPSKISAHIPPLLFSSVSDGRNRCPNTRRSKKGHNRSNASVNIIMPEDLHLSGGFY